MKWYWDKSYHFRMCADGVIRSCAMEGEMRVILETYHSTPVGSHHDGMCTTIKVLQSEFYWPTLYRNSHELMRACKQCQRHEGISRRHEIPLQPSMDLKLFDVWGLDFMRPFMSSYKNLYILIWLIMFPSELKSLSCQIIKLRVLLNSWRGTSLPELALLVVSWVMGVLIFAINYFGPCLLNMDSSIKLSLCAILKPMSWQKCLIKR